MNDSQRKPTIPPSSRRRTLYALVFAAAAGVLAVWRFSSRPTETVGAESARDRRATRRTASAHSERPVRAGDPAPPTERDDSSAGGSARSPLAAPPAASGRTLARAQWGGNDGQLGRLRPSEGNAEAPMSLAVAQDGTLLVLDQVNGRVARFGPDGRALGNIPVTLRAAQDLALTRDGAVAVLDRLGDRSVAIIGTDGRERGRFDLVGRGVTEGGAVTSLVVDGDGVYVEREHGPLVRVGDTNGRPDSEREEIPGRPTRDGRLYIAAGIVDASTGRFFVNAVERPSQQHRYTREFRMDGPIGTIVMLDSDRNGTIYVALVVRTAAPGSADITEAIRLLCLEPTHGSPAGQATLPINSAADETFREIAALDEGGVVYMQRDAQGVTLQRYDCR